MKKKSFIWLVEPTHIELWTEASAEGAPVAILYSGPVATGEEIPVALDADHKIVASWLAFKMIAEAPEPKAPVKPSQKEINNG